MRTAITSLVCIQILLAVLASSGPLWFERTWVWYPMNSVLEDGELQSGLLFYFEEPPAEQAYITVWGKRGDEPFTVSATIDTDRVHGDTFFRFDIRNIDTFVVDKIYLKVGKVEQTKLKPHQGTYYVF